MRYFYSLFILSLSLSASAEAGELRCNISAIAKCLCEAPMTVKCGDKLGHIKNTTKLSQVKLLILNSNGSTREYILDKPPGGAGDFINLDNKWLKEKVDLKADETLAIAENGFILDSSTVLFKDHHAKEELGAISSAPANSDFCQYDDVKEKPMLLTYSKGCGKNKLCAMKVKCELPKEIQKKYGYPAFVNQDAVCPVKEDGSCPSPTECALEQKVVFENESEESIFGAGKPSKDKSGTSQQ